MERNKAVLQQNDVYQYLSKSIDAVTKINGKIIKELGRDKQIGHSFFFRVFDQGALMRVWQYEILPLLEEYFDCDYDKILQALEVTEQNLYINNRIGIKGFTKIEELDSFLDLVLNKAGSTNG
jgi:hypothetical protein